MTLPTWVTSQLVLLWYQNGHTVVNAQRTVWLIHLILFGIFILVQSIYWPFSFIVLFHGESDQFLSVQSKQSCWENCCLSKFIWKCLGFFSNEREHNLRWQNWQNLWQLILAQSVYCPEQEDTPYLAQSAMASWQGSIRGGAAKKEAIVLQTLLKEIYN